MNRETFNPDFALAESAHRAATHLFGAGGVTPACPAVAVANGGTIPQVTPPKAESQRDAACKFCNRLAKFGFNVKCETGKRDEFTVMGISLSFHV